MAEVYSKLKEFKKKYPVTIAWRIKAHAKVIEKHLNPGEEVIYAFLAQKNDTYKEIFRTFAVVLTNRRLILAQSRVIFGYLFLSITPDMFNDLTIQSDLIWGTVIIDTIKEQVKLTNIEKEALPEIETAITEYMMKEKQKYINNNQIETN